MHVMVLAHLVHGKPHMWMAHKIHSVEGFDHCNGVKARKFPVTDYVQFDILKVPLEAIMCGFCFPLFTNRTVEDYLDSIT